MSLTPTIVTFLIVVILGTERGKKTRANSRLELGDEKMEMRDAEGLYGFTYLALERKLIAQFT
jgi:hypothetical protein